MPKIKIGILDFGYREKTASGIDILADVFEYSLFADQLGFSSYWISEHHNSGLAWSNPEMLIPILAGHTSKINIGLTGILLASHSPYRVALNFKLVESLFPGRIDLGLASASVELGVAQKLLNNKDLKNDYFLNYSSNVKELLSYFSDDQNLLINDKVLIPPYGGGIPRIWKLSSSFNGLDDCLNEKMNISRSMFHSKIADPIDANKIKEFRSNFFARHGFYPRINIAISGICEKYDKSARKTVHELNLKRLPLFDQLIIGSPEFFKDKILEIYENSSIDEFIFYDQGTNFKKRMKTLELLATEFQF